MSKAVENDNGNLKGKLIEEDEFERVKYKNMKDKTYDEAKADFLTDYDKLNPCEKGDLESVQRRVTISLDNQ